MHISASSLAVSAAFVLLAFAPRGPATSDSGSRRSVDSGGIQLASAFTIGITHRQHTVKSIVGRNKLRKNGHTGKGAAEGLPSAFIIPPMIIPHKHSTTAISSTPLSEGEGDGTLDEVSIEPTTNSAQLSVGERRNRPPFEISVQSGSRVSKDDIYLRLVDVDGSTTKEFLFKRQNLVRNGVSSSIVLSEDDVGEKFGELKGVIVRKPTSKFLSVNFIRKDMRVIEEREENPVVPKPVNIDEIAAVEIPTGLFLRFFRRYRYILEELPGPFIGDLSKLPFPKEVSSFEVLARTPSRNADNTNKYSKYAKEPVQWNLENVTINGRDFVFDAELGAPEATVKVIQEPNTRDPEFTSLAPGISYNLPDLTPYNGRHTVALPNLVEDTWWKDAPDGEPGSNTSDTNAWTWKHIGDFNGKIQDTSDEDNGQYKIQGFPTIPTSNVTSFPELFSVIPGFQKVDVYEITIESGEDITDDNIFLTLVGVDGRTTEQFLFGQTLVQNSSTTTRRFVSAFDNLGFVDAVRITRAPKGSRSPEPVNEPVVNNGEEETNTGEAEATREEATNPGEDAENSSEEATNPGEDAENSSEGATNPGEDAENSSEGATNPGEDAENNTEGGATNPGEKERPAAKKRYTFLVSTGSGLYDGTDADIFVSLKGTSGQETDIVQINGSFEKSEADRIVKEGLKDVGTLKSITVTNSGGGNSPDWYLSSISVNGQEATFNRWINSGKTETAEFDKPEVILEPWNLKKVVINGRDFESKDGQQFISIDATLQGPGRQFDDIESFLNGTDLRRSFRDQPSNPLAFLSQTVRSAEFDMGLTDFLIPAASGDDFGTNAEDMNLTDFRIPTAYGDEIGANAEFLPTFGLMVRETAEKASKYFGLLFVGSIKTQYSVQTIVRSENNKFTVTGSQNVDLPEVSNTSLKITRRGAIFRGFFNEKLIGEANLKFTKDAVSSRNVAQSGSIKVLNEALDVGVAYFAPQNYEYKGVKFATSSSEVVLKNIPSISTSTDTFTTGRKNFSIVELINLSSFYGTYGAGRTINTFTLLPGEETTMSIRSYKDSITKSMEASTIFDSFTNESADELEKSIEEEQANAKQYEQSREVHAEVRGSYSGMGASVSASVGASASDSAARQEMAQSVMSAVSKHASEASSKRDVEINTTSESEVSDGTEESVVRNLKNINSGKTLNFVFRQMNQEYISVLHLVGLRVAYIGGGNGTYVEEDVSNLESFVQGFVKKKHVEKVVNRLYRKLQFVTDYNENIREVLTKKTLDFSTMGTITFPHDPDVEDAPTSYIAFDKNIKSVLSRSVKYGFKIEVPGVILAYDTNVLRTDGIVAEAILGKGDALDTYGKALQEEDIKKQNVDSRVQDAKVDLLYLQKHILTQGVEDNTITKGQQLEGLSKLNLLEPKLFYPKSLDASEDE